MRSILLAFLFSIASTGFCQCEVSKSKIENGDFLFESGVEKLFEHNLISIASYTAVSLSELDKNKVKYMLVILSAAPTGTNFVPRKLVVNLGNGTSIPLIAEEKLPSSYKSNREYESCIYRLTLDVVDIVLTNTVRSVEVIDHYTSKRIVGTPYNEWLKNQFTCLFKSVSDM